MLSDVLVVLRVLTLSMLPPWSGRTLKRGLEVAETLDTVLALHRWFVMGMLW